MNIYHGLFPLGIGTNRLPISGVKDVEGIQRSAEIILAALNHGASYVDVAHTYSRGFALEACRIAFEQYKNPLNVTIKSSFRTDKKADDALRRIDSIFMSLGIGHASYFVIWNIDSMWTFEQIMKPGSLYDGALAAKKKGYIDHICFSSHAPVDELIVMMGSGAFEGATISYSAMNSIVMKPVLNCALENNIGIAVMNPLGGGVIPHNEKYYSFLRHQSDGSLAQAALRYVYAHPAVNIVLSGLSSIKELEDNVLAFGDLNEEPNSVRLERVEKTVKDLDGYCTGCRYCDGCPTGIPVHAIMQSHNAMLFDSPPAYHRTDPELLRDIQMFRKLNLEFQFIPDIPVSPCVQCGKCKANCTKGLEVIETVKKVYQRAEYRCYAMSSRKERLDILLNGKSYRRVAFYPGGGYARVVLELYRNFFKDSSFEVVFFDNNPAMWGTRDAGVTIYSPREIESVKPDVILITTYNYVDEIYAQLERYKRKGMAVERLHAVNDVPWNF